MFEQIKWEEVYLLWNYSNYNFSEILSAPITVETVFVEYKKDGYIYGFDWLQNEDAQERKKLIKNNPEEFLYFTKPTNKGTIQTAQMLVESQSNEELAAVWIAANAKELYEYKIGNDVTHYSYIVYGSMKKSL